MQDHELRERLALFNEILIDEVFSAFIREYLSQVCKTFSKKEPFQTIRCIHYMVLHHIFTDQSALIG